MNKYTKIDWLVWFSILIVTAMILGGLIGIILK